jgi:4a-hydroxytetrahydrobiopterin dehydratase
MAMKLIEQKCEPCRGGTPPLSRQDAQVMLNEIPDWMLKDASIERTFQFRDFKESISFINKVAEIANEQDHHPDIHIYYSKVRIELSTHKINGLSKNDFILAAKIDDLLKTRMGQ